MASETLTSIVNELAEANIGDLNILRLQTILQSSSGEEIIHVESADPLWKLSVQYLHIQRRFLTTCLIQEGNVGNGTVDETLINLQLLAGYTTALDRIRQFTLSLYLPKELRGLTRCDLKLMIQLEPEERLKRLRFCLESFRELFDLHVAGLQAKLEDCVLEYIAGVFGYHFLKGDFQSLSGRELYKNFNMFPLETLFKGLLVIKGVSKLPLEIAKQVHMMLLHLTGTAGGFPVLCKTLLVNVPSDETPTWKKSEVIAKIVAIKGHRKAFYRQVLQDCFNFYENSLLNRTEDGLLFASTCIECMKQMYLLPPAYEELRETIREYFMGRFKPLTEPTELLSGMILFERTQLIMAIYINYMAFSGSSYTSLTSSILVPYLHILVKLYSMLPNGVEEKQYLQSIIVFCLSNREKSELESILAVLLLGTEDLEPRKKMHPRIYLKVVEAQDDYSLQIGPDQTMADEENLGSVIVEILKEANRNLLIYDVFVTLLKLFDHVSEKTDNKVLLDAEEQDAIRCKSFFQKYVLIQALMDLISHKHFHSQLYENPSEILDFIKSLVEKNLDGVQPNESLLEIILSIFQYLQRLQTRNDVQEILGLLRRFRTSVRCSEQLRTQIDLICEGSSHKRSDNLESSPYQTALSLLSDKEPYCKVYGTTLMLRLLKERDKEALASKHAILILTLNNLRNVESYAFLNSVRLLVGLCDCLESETIEALIKEYQSGDSDVDFRLKVGEALVKTVESVGPIAFKYKEQLINCFLHESKSSVDEIRSSSLANLGNVCKILSYQVHNFFYEMFLVIKSAIETDHYLPVRRAAILILSQLIEGIDNLLAFQDYLLLVYRFLKFVVATEQDGVTRLQAAVALDHLTAKTTEFLSASTATDRLEKEIRIFGIKDQAAEERRQSSLSSNSILTKLLD
ncbi:transport and Golgi organization protein 6 [Topomyia yanbarensis]|uniref:transport and Golgi organization protein 6 n=1 Tax=Topomyia yanbarensis TaxID=2498891 RepID=UPI00273C7484|nr:transport and Golgi organization protein 6 [Topomyia yanbarensis]